MFRPVKVDEIAVGQSKTFAPEADFRCLPHQTRPQGLRMRTAAPPRGLKASIHGGDFLYQNESQDFSHGGHRVHRDRKKMLSLCDLCGPFFSFYWSYLHGQVSRADPLAP